MNPTVSKCNLKEILDALPSVVFQDGYLANFNNDLRIPAMENGSVNGESSSPLRLTKLNPGGGLDSPSERFQEVLEHQKEEISISIPSSINQIFRKRIRVLVARKVDWEALKKSCEIWFRNPLNMALLLWISCVVVSGAILFLVMTGMLNAILPDKLQRDVWFEVNNQILNALFTLMCLYHHPKRFHHLVLLCRWNPKDISMLRKIYCKNGTHKPRERAHIMVVIVLLHVNCFAQYALCGLNLGYKRSERPVVGIGICLSIAIAAPTIAGVHSLMSPLGKEYDFEVDEEAQVHNLANGIACPIHSRLKSFERRFSFASRNEQKIVEYEPKWKGGLLDLWDDIPTSCVSLFCCFCLFGWNMERLGFGNMYVHVATFFLFCTAPFWIFNLAAVNIDNETIKEALGLTGISLCLFGLLYGGFWRIQTRKRFNLPANYVCCGKPAVTDCAQWLFCCWCSLAQEVRTADFYDMMEDKFSRRHSQPVVFPLPHEDGVIQFGTPNPSIVLRNSPKLSGIRKGSSWSPHRHSNDCFFTDEQLPKVEDEVIYDFMKPPILSAIQREDSTIKKA